MAQRAIKYATCIIQYLRQKLKEYIRHMDYPHNNINIKTATKVYPLMHIAHD